MARLTSSRVISRLRPATATTPRLLKALTWCAGERQVHAVDLDAGGQFRLVDGALDGLGRRVHVVDDAAPDALRLGQADADDVQAPVVHHLADDGGDLRRADIESDQIALFPCHAHPRSSAHASPRRALLHNHRVVVGPRDPSTPTPSSAPACHPQWPSTNLEPLEELLVTQPQFRRLALEQDHGVPRIRNVDLGDAAERNPGARTPPGCNRWTRRVPAASARGPDGVSVSRPSTIGRSNCRYFGPKRAMMTPAASTRKSCPCSRAATSGVRSTMRTCTVDGSTRDSSALGDPRRLEQPEAILRQRHPQNALARAGPSRALRPPRSRTARCRSPRRGSP